MLEATAYESASIFIEIAADFGSLAGAVGLSNQWLDGLGGTGMGTNPELAGLGCGGSSPLHGPRIGNVGTEGSFLPFP